MLPHTVAVALIVFAGCSSKVDTAAQTSSVTASNVTLTAAQRQTLRLVTIQQSSFHKTIEADGTVEFDQDQSTSIIAPFSGPVSKLLVSVGDRVTPGQPLADVDSPDFATAISTYQKALATAKTNRKLADLDQGLLQHNGVAQKEAAQAETDAANAEADRDAARQALVSLNVDLQTIKAIDDGKPVARPTGVLRSPIAGTVTEKLINPGELLQAGTTACFTVADLSRVWVMTRVFGSDVTAVSVGDTAEVLTGVTATNFSGTVGNISPEIDPDTRAVLVRVVTANPNDALKKEMYVRVRIQARKEDTGLLAPVSAVLRDDENLPFVYVTQPDGSFARNSVTLGYRVGDQYEIPTGLKGGEQVVADGAIFLQFLQNQ